MSAAAAAPERHDRRLTLDPPRRKPGLSDAQYNAELIAWCFGQKRCQCSGLKCTCGSSLRMNAQDPQHAVQYIPTSGQGTSHKFCLHALIVRHFDPKLIPTGAKKFWSAVEASGVYLKRRRTHKYYTTAVLAFREGKRATAERDPPLVAGASRGANQFTMFTDAYLFRAELEDDWNLLSSRGMKYLKVRGALLSCSTPRWTRLVRSRAATRFAWLRGC